MNTQLNHLHPFISTVKLITAVVVSILLPCSVESFSSTISVSRRLVPSLKPHEGGRKTSPLARKLFVDPAMLGDLHPQPAIMMENAVNFITTSSTALLAFSDQGTNLAGIFFQASLLPYLIFLYFLSFRANRLSNLANFGFQFVLLFVLSTIPSGIVTKSIYGESLANVDWLHGGAETLLTVANILVVVGLRQAMTEPNPPTMNTPRNIALATAGIFAVSLALGPVLNVEAHSPFLFGLGNLPGDVVLDLPWVSHNEPENALSIPTWAIHFSSVLEYLFAMNLVWNYSETTQNPTWKGLTWGMLPLHASGICACTYHFFYNPTSLQFLVTAQAALTLIGNITCMIAAFRIARSNGWVLEELRPLPRSSTSPMGLVADGVASMSLQLQEAKQSTAELALELVALTLLLSYAVKYGELGLDLPFTPNSAVAVGLVAVIPSITAFQYYRLSSNGATDSVQPKLSMEDIRRYGVAGTLAYVVTEIAFWIVAFPVAAFALYQSTGHWPDVWDDTGDRAAVLAFIFAGANVARAFVPLRLGAALALAPWVDENIINQERRNDNLSDGETNQDDSIKL